MGLLNREPVMYHSEERVLVFPNVYQSIALLIMQLTKGRSGLGKNHKEETKSKISGSVKGQNSVHDNKGKPVYLYLVHSHGLELSTTFANRFRASEVLGIPPSTLFNYIIVDCYLTVNGVSSILSWD
ncbi:6502_t:CDS:1, partial [Dentiscutata heterogama]